MVKLSCPMKHSCIKEQLPRLTGMDKLPLEVSIGSQANPLAIAKQVPHV